MPVQPLPEPPVEEKLEILLNRLEGALDRTERKIANHTLGGYPYPKTDPEKKD